MIRTENGCIGKIRYDTKEQANTAVANFNRKKGKRMVSYYCKTCDGVHLGHENKGKTMQHDQKMKPISYVHVSGVHKLDDGLED